MYYVYIIKSKKYPEKRYVGFTEKLKERLQKHNRGESIHTAKNKPWQLVSCVLFSDKMKALEFEKYLKSHSGRAFGQKRLW